MTRRAIKGWVLAGILGGSTLAAATVAFVPDDPDAPTSSTLSIRVELERNRLYATSGDGQVDTFKVSVGSEYHPTPKGEFAIRRLIWNPSWTPPPSKWARDSKPAGPGDPDNPMGRVKMFFKHPDYYIHGTNQDELVGHVSSHGCVRLRNADAIALAQLVMRHGGVERPDSWFERVLARVRRSEHVHLSRAVPVVVEEGEPWPILGTPVAEAEEAAPAGAGR